MSGQQIEKVLDEIGELRSPVAAVVLFGGEPTLRWDLVRNAFHYWHAKKKCAGMRWILFTNGSLLSQGRLLELRRAGVELFVSFDGFDNRSRMRYSGTKASTEKVVLSSMKEAVGLGIETTVVLTIGTHNIGFVQHDFEVLFREFGVSRFRVNILHKTGMAVPEAVVSRVRAGVLQWAKSVGAEVWWDSPRSQGSKFNNYFVSQASVRYLPAGRKALWQDVRW